MSRTLSKTYEELCTLPTYEERFRYLKLNGKPTDETFGEYRYLNQQFYTSTQWKEVRNFVIARDLGCDLGVMDHNINGHVYVHHINPITPEDLILHSEIVTDPNNLICVSMGTHNALHYGDETWILNATPLIRMPGDTCPWKEI